MKKWYQSYTVWFNVILILIATITELGNIIPIPQDILVWFASLGNFILRFKTTKELI